MSYIIEDCSTCVDCSAILELPEIPSSVCEAFRTNPPERLFFANVNGTAITKATLSEIILQGRLDATGVEKIVATPATNYTLQLGPPAFTANAVVTETSNVLQRPTIVGTDFTGNVVIPFLYLSTAQKKAYDAFLNCPEWAGQLAIFWVDTKGFLYYFELGAPGAETMQGFWLDSQAMTSLSMETLTGGIGSAQTNSVQMNFKESFWDCGMNAISAPYARTIEKTVV